MANTKSAKKMIRKIARRSLVNKIRRTRMRTSIRKLEKAIELGDKKQAAEALQMAQADIMRSAQKGILHMRAAARKISRLPKRFNKLA